MAQLQIRDKIKIIADAVKQDNLIKERPKRIGLRLFFILSIVWIIGILILALLLAVNQYVKTAGLLLILTAISFYIVYKLMTAEDLNSL